MPPRHKKPSDAEVNREIHEFAMRALDLAKAVVDGKPSEADKQTAAELAQKIPGFAARAKDLSDAYRADAQRVLADARLDLAYVAAGGGIPSSIRLGRYIAEQSSAPSN